MAKAAVVETNEEGTAIQKVTSGPQRLLLFLKDVRNEMRKVVAPSRQEVQNNTIVVIVTVFIFAAFFALVDQIFGRGIDAIFFKLTRH